MKGDLTAQYDTWHQKMSSHEEDVLNLPWYKTVLSILPDLDGRKILEVGCGRGVFAEYLASKFPGAHIVAVDFSSNAIDIASQRYQRKNLKFYQGDAEALPFGDKEFDFYISCETIEHVLHPQKMIHEIDRVLKPKGRFILTTENYSNAYLLVWLKCWLLKKQFESGCGIQPRENFFIFPMLLRMFKKAKLKIKETRSNHYQWFVFPGVDPAKLRTDDIRPKLLRFLFKPFGRHFTYSGEK